MRTLSIGEACTARLAPERLSCSPKFTAVVAYIVGERWTDPAITGLWLTSDGVLLAGTEDDPMADDIIGEASDMTRNMHGVAEAVGLSSDERAWLYQRMRSRITGWYDPAGAHDMAEARS